MALPEYQELNLEAIASRLTWHPMPDKDFRERMFGRAINLSLGTVCRDTDGDLWLVGSMDEDGNDFGCGCCTHEQPIAAIAFLAELLN